MSIESDGKEVRSLAVGGAQATQAGGDSGGMPLSVGRSRPDQTANILLNEALGTFDAGDVMSVNLAEQIREHLHAARAFPAIQPDPPVPARGDDTRVATGVKSALVNDGSTPSGPVPTLAELEAILQPGNPRPVGRCATTQTERYRVDGCTCKTYPGNEGLPCLTWCQGGAAGACVYCDHNLDCHRRLSAMFGPAPIELFPKVNGIGRLATWDAPDAAEAERVLEVYFTRRPTDDEMRAFHDYVRNFQVSGSSACSANPANDGGREAVGPGPDNRGHTPGSFVVDAERPTYPQADRPLGYYVAHAESGGRVAQVFENCLVTTEEEALANAQLFAAAPRLLAHLRFAVKILGGMPGIGGTAQVDAMRAAIDAARVEPSKIARQFCEFCGAGVGLFRRDGEGTCNRCDPVAPPKAREHG